MYIILCVTLVTLITILVIMKKKNTQQQESSSPKIPVLENAWPILGNLLTILQYPSEYHLAEHEKSFKRLNTDIFIIKSPGIPNTVSHVLTTNPDIVKHITSTKFDSIYEKGGQNNYYQLLGNGIFNSNGDQWKKHRNAAITLFHAKNLSNYVEIFERNANTLIKTFEFIKNQNKNEFIDLQDYFMRYTLDSFCEIAFGVSLHSIEKESNYFADAFDSAQTHTERKVKLGSFWYLMQLLNPIKDLDKKYDFINETVNNMIIYQKSQSNSVLENQVDVLSSIILNSRKNQSSSFSDKDLRDFIVNFLIAGRDTTAVLLTWTFYYLSLHPDVEEKIIDEISNVIGNDELNAKNIKKLNYLKYVLQEVLRLRPPVPVDGYISTQDDILPGGFEIKKGTHVVYVSKDMHVREDYFDNPTEFIPERFKEPNGCIPGKSHPAVYVPFHFGPRSCLGKEMAYEEAKVMICKLLTSGFKFRLRKGFEPELKHSLILTSKNGMQMNFCS